MENILNEIKEERERQNRKCGEQNHHPVEWLAILTEETGEVAKEVVELTFTIDQDKAKVHTDNYRKELIQVAAVAVQMIECLDRITCIEID